MSRRLVSPGPWLVHRTAFELVVVSLQVHCDHQSISELPGSSNAPSLALGRVPSLLGSLSDPSKTKMVLMMTRQKVEIMSGHAEDSAVPRA